MSVTITVNQTIQDWYRDYLALEFVVWRWACFTKLGRNTLLDAMVGSLLIVVFSISRDDFVKLLSMGVIIFFSGIFALSA